MTKEIAKQIRADLKVMKDFKFSVRTEYFSGGSSISISVMKSPVRLIKNIDEISDDAKNVLISHSCSNEKIEKYQSGKYFQLNHYQLNRDYNCDEMCNGVFLTEMGHNALQKVMDIVNKYHWDESDVQADYFSTNFYIHLELGKWDKEFMDGDNNDNNN